MNDIRLVMCDLDDTLKSKDGGLSDFTKRAIVALRNKGIFFGIATGRSSNSVRRTLKEIHLLELCDVIITMNGAQEYDMKFDRKHSFYPLDKKTLIDLGKILEPLDLNYCLYDNDYQYAKRDDHAIQRIGRNNLSTPTFYELKDLPDILYSKIMFLAPSEKKETAMALFNQHKPAHVRGFFSDPDLIEIVDSRVSKSYAIEQFCIQHGFTIANVMAFGDHNNDIEMLKDCGIGVCVSNGNPEAKAAADYIALSCEENGVAHFLNDYLKLELTH